jgi:UBX domain-containing protein 1
MPYSDPENEAILRAIKQGRAPPSLMNVEPGQHTDVNVFRRMDEKYQPPTSTKTFRGSGNRLGSPVPDISGSSTSAPLASAPVTEPLSSGPRSNGITLDASQPTISLQIRLGDGTRMVSRFNPTHTIEDLYRFVRASSLENVNTTRNWVLMTTFPSKELSDKSATIGDVAELKKGGVVIQRWV